MTAALLDPPSRELSAAGRRPEDLLRWLVGALLLPLLLVPIGFISPPERLWQVLAVGYAVAVGGVLWRAVVLRDRPCLVALVVLLGLVVTTAAAGGTALSSAAAVGSVLAGLLWARCLRRPAPVLAAVFVGAVALLLAEALLRRHVYYDLFPNPLFVPYLDLGFRARGLAGHPVPGAFLVTLLAVYLWHAAAGAPRHRGLLRTAVLVLAAAGLLTTGTRSALVVLAVVLPLTARLGGDRRDRRPERTIALAWLGATLAVALAASGTALPTARVLAFDELASSESLVVRERAVEALTSLNESCGTACLIAGHGHRAFQAGLQAGAAAATDGPSTVDNQLVSLFWDHGLLGLAALLSLVPLAVGVLRRRVPGAPRAGAAALLAVVASALFFDAVYVSSCAFLAGAALALARPHVPEEAP